MNVQEIANQNENLKKGILLLAGWIAAVLSLFIYPFVFGMIGVVSGILATKNNKSRIGVYLVVSSIALMGIGLVFSTNILSWVYHR
ncbi:MAG TPA: hypothetical protein VIK78_18425 [Ruminiclostridium sp.]